MDNQKPAENDGKVKVIEKIGVWDYPGREVEPPEHKPGTVKVLKKIVIDIPAKTTGNIKELL